MEIDVRRKLSRETIGIVDFHIWEVSDIKHSLIKYFDGMLAVHRETISVYDVKKLVEEVFGEHLEMMENVREMYRKHGHGEI